MTITIRKLITHVEHETSKFYDVDNDDYSNAFAVMYDRAMRAYVSTFDKTHNARDAHNDAFLTSHTHDATRDVAMYVANECDRVFMNAHIHVCVDCANVRNDRSTFDQRVARRVSHRRVEHKRETYTTCVHCASLTIRETQRCINCYEFHDA